MTDNTTSCKATLYVCSPSVLIPSSLKDGIMKREPSLGDVTGHAFFGITDKNGKETIYGLHTAAVLPENKHQPKNKKLAMLFGVTGVVMDDSKEAYDDKMVYDISQDQYDKIKAYAEKKKENPPKYHLLFNNCVSFAYKALHQAKLDLPPQPIMYNPASVVLGIRIYEKAVEIKKTLSNAAANILSKFSPTRKISRDILQGMKRKSDKRAVGIRSVVASLKNNTMSLLKKRATER